MPLLPAEVGRTRDQAGEVVVGRVERLLDRLAGGHGFALVVDGRVRHPNRRGRSRPRRPAIRATTVIEAERSGPVRRGRGASLGRVGAAGGDQVVGCPERLVGDPEDGLRAGDVGGLERVAVRGVVVLEVGGGRADVRAQHEQRRLVGLRLRRTERGLEHVEVVGDSPSSTTSQLYARNRSTMSSFVDRSVAPSMVMWLLSKTQIRRAQAEMARQRRGLVADALHHAAVAGDHERVVVLRVVAETGAQAALGDRHADRVAEALSERPGGDLDADGVAGLGVTGRAGVPLAEVAQVVEFEAVPDRKSIVYCRIDAWPFERMKRSRSGQCGSAGSWFMMRLNSTWATGASAIAVPWWPLLAASGASMAMPRTRETSLGILFGGQRHAEDSTRPGIPAICPPGLDVMPPREAPATRLALGRPCPLRRDSP